MKSWINFFLIPIVFLIIISILNYWYSINILADSKFYIVFLVLLFSLFISVPYLMLITSPKFPYISTIIYMIIIFFIVTFFYSGENLIGGIYGFITWTLIAMIIYFFTSRKKL
jgi:hypothetical protein